MVNQELRDYISHCRQAGQSHNQIKTNLVENGWDPADVDETLAENPNAGVPQPIALQPVSYQKHFSSLLVLSLGVVVPAIVAKLLFYWVWSMAYVNILTKVGIGIIEVLAIFLTLWFALSLIFYVSNVSAGISNAVHRALRRLNSYIWIVILLDLVLQFGYILLIIPGIVFAVWFSFSTFVLAQEDAKGLNAMLKSKEYVRGAWWQVFGTLLWLGAIAVAIILASAVIAGNSHGMLVPTFVLIGMGLLLLVYYPFALVTFYNLFARIKNKKGIVTVPAEGRGLFGTFAVLGILLPILFLMLFALLAGSESHGWRHSHVMMQPYGNGGGYGQMNTPMYAPPSGPVIQQ